VVGDLLQPTHLLFVLVVALLVLGPKRLPEVARTLGNGLRDFRAAINGERSDDDDPPEGELTPYVGPAVDETHTNGSETTAEAEPVPATAESIPEPAVVTAESVPEPPEPNLTPEPVVKPPPEAAAPAAASEAAAPAAPETAAPVKPEPDAPAVAPEPTAEHPVPTGQAPKPDRLP
jgi:sec-independent protein translocase protein TatA